MTILDEIQSQIQLGFCLPPSWCTYIVSSLLAIYRLPHLAFERKFHIPYYTLPLINKYIGNHALSHTCIELEHGKYRSKTISHCLHACKLKNIVLECLELIPCKIIYIISHFVFVRQMYIVHENETVAPNMIIDRAWLQTTVCIVSKLL